jgi:hypothetical protein
MAQELSAKEEAYLAFLGYPEEVRRHIYSTNVVESPGAGIEQMPPGWSLGATSPRRTLWR